MSTTNYPASLDTITKPNRILDAQNEAFLINRLIDAVLAIEAQFGVGTDGIMTLPNGMKWYTLTSAITANSTTTAAPAGSIGVTSHATGIGKLFTSDGSKWQFMAVA